MRDPHCMQVGDTFHQLVEKATGFLLRETLGLDDVVEELASVRIFLYIYMCLCICVYVYMY
jgi:hypothetical protein